MAHLLKNENLEIHIDLPNENYNASRFDWTGKIIQVNFKGLPISSVEDINCDNEHHFGKGFYNEFGIDMALGFDDTKIGGWFHKIGIGLLKKESSQYHSSIKYKIKPAVFHTNSDLNSLSITCESEAINGYSYLLTKTIELRESHFIITYNLNNTGEKDIITDEYVHNFISINHDIIGTNYELKFPFKIKPELFDEHVNPEQKINIKSHQIDFNGSPNKQFFFSYLAGNEKVEANWKLLNHANNIVINEVGSFKSPKVNLWGWKHVVSPELFHTIFIKPGESDTWSRTYHISHIIKG